jgi:hypothetical protein
MFLYPRWKSNYDEVYISDLQLSSYKHGGFNNNQQKLINRNLNKDRSSTIIDNNNNKHYTKLLQQLNSNEKYKILSKYCNNDDSRYVKNKNIIEMTITFYLIIPPLIDL